MNNILNNYSLGDISLSYITDGSGHVGMVLLPTDKTEGADFLGGDIESIVQLYIRGDNLPSGKRNHALRLTVDENADI